MSKHALPALPYGYDALEPYIDATTMSIHHTKHHQAYVNNLNAAAEKAPELKDMDVAEVCKAVGAGELPADVVTTVRNNGGGEAPPSPRVRRQGERGHRLEACARRG